MQVEELRARAARRKFAIQALLIVGVIIIIWSAIASARINLTALGITSGFGFLERSTGWSYSFSLIERDINDTYTKTLWIGFQNSVFVGFISIVLSTVLGFAIGTARDAHNLSIKAAATTFVQIFRNIPLILQVVFWYAILIHMPGPRQAISVGELAFISNRGVMVPGLNVTSGIAVGIIAFSVLLFIALTISKATFGKKLILWFSGSILALFLSGVLFTPAGESILSIPTLKGLRFVGGITVSIELVAMIVSIVLYGSAYIAEVVRGGLQEVPKGLIEAGQAIGLPQRAIWSRIKMPMALRTIIPPLGNQWIFIMKATTIGVAIGFSDLFYIVSTSITQSGQTLELIALLMGAFLTVNYLIAQLTNWLNASLKLKGH
ncbi:ABC transporter permease subunit [Epibacterium ulvae]|uniref:ABC transporter permease subunit n=1 Tax=Epibacterium ulvae TaxID=1156985 RepID=UPI0024920B58|nr:ABC transporter permease subunit [Epibacterium ulvae]